MAFGRIDDYYYALHSVRGTLNEKVMHIWLDAVSISATSKLVRESFQCCFGLKGLKTATQGVTSNS